MPGNFSSKSKIITAGSGIQGTELCMTLSLAPTKENADAIAAGSGAGVPTATGTVPAGTIKDLSLVMLNSSGQWIPASSPDLASGASVPIALVVAGNEDSSGQAVGQITAAMGIAELELDSSIVDAGTYAPGTPLVANAGKWAEATGATTTQKVGWVGHRGKLPDGTVHAFFDRSFR